MLEEASGGDTGRVEDGTHKAVTGGAEDARGPDEPNARR
jgi:hypothetical protein